MTSERFLSLLRSYGADLQRWPAAERRAAAALLEHGPAELRQRVSEAAVLDGWLDDHPVANPDRALVDRIVAAAAATAPSSAASLGWRGRAWWWRGAGLVAIGLAGSLAGAFVVSVALQNSTPPSVDWPERTTAFGGLPADWSEE
jgi:hypothetical protein